MVFYQVVEARKVWRQARQDQAKSSGICNRRCAKAGAQGAVE